MRYPRLIPVIFLLSVLALACSKEKDAIYHGKIKNSISMPVVLKLYGTSEDYANETNALASATIPAHGFWQVPDNFDGGQNLYLDWYSEDYAYTNWGGDPSFNVANITTDMDPVMTIGYQENLARAICLNNTKTSTEWEAYDVVSGDWQWLSDNERYKRITFRKDRTGVYQYKNAQGEIRSMDFTFTMNSFSSPYIYIQFPNDQTGGSYAIVPSTDGFGYSTDTIFTQNYIPQSNSHLYYFRKLP